MRRPTHPGGERGYLYVPRYVDDARRQAILAWLATLHPLWERRYSTVRPLPPGRQQKQLLRPVYWLGNWQFACLGYYEPPRGVRDRCVAAEPLPPPLAAIAADVEQRVRRTFAPVDVPAGWCLNTCLVNFYGSRREGDRWEDVARVGEHRDHEPGPVASVSLGERALFQFVRRGGPGATSGAASARGGAPERRWPGASAPVRTQWLDDGSLQVFGGPLWKDDLLHRVQRVERKLELDLPPAIDGFRTRRINFTFRFVPPAHVVPFARLGGQAQADVRGYVEELAAHSAHFRAALAGLAAR
ncbi:MAG TPA: alpha-ketoglutarate-dependent dioxygenase AlkB [Kofleriaceae bacterium]|nr:alpha-ketoglutarate-dependent dioxygenase AlkB [Kofleriaceae bacterium]